MRDPSPIMNLSSYTKSTQRKKIPSSSKIPDEGSQPMPSVMALQRYMPYIQPYQHDWVRVLKVIQTVPECPRLSLEEGGVKSGRIYEETVEWKERWVVIYDGVVNIRRNLTVRNSSFIQSQTNPLYLFF